MRELVLMSHLKSLVNCFILHCHRLYLLRTLDFVLKHKKISCKYCIHWLMQVHSLLIRPLSPCVWFYDGQPKLCTKFEVVSFSFCRNIEEEPLNFGELPKSRATLPFLCAILWWAFEIPSGMQHLKSLAPAVADILRGNRKFWVAPQFRSTFTLFCVAFDDGPWQTPAAC